MYRDTCFLPYLPHIIIDSWDSTYFLNCSSNLLFFVLLKASLKKLKAELSKKTASKGLFSSLVRVVRVCSVHSVIHTYLFA